MTEIVFENLQYKDMLTCTLCYDKIESKDNVVTVSQFGYTDDKDSTKHIKKIKNMYALPLMTDIETRKDIIRILDEFNKKGNVLELKDGNPYFVYNCLAETDDSWLVMNFCLTQGEFANIIPMFVMNIKPELPEQMMEKDINGEISHVVLSEKPAVYYKARITK